jgi:hypothetical protein
MTTPLALTCTPSWIEAAAADPAGPAPLPRFTMVAYNGGPMRVFGWRHPVVVDLAGLAIPSQARPIRLQHDADQGVGHTTAIRIDAGALLAEGVISRDTAAAREVVVSSRNGFPWQASIGSSVVEHEFLGEGTTAEVNGRTVTGPLNVVRKSVLGEISFVDLGADGATSAAVAASRSPQPPDTAKESTMLTVQILAAMIASHPLHTALISAEAQKPDATEDTIKAALAVAELQAAKDGRAAAEAALAQAQAEHAAAIQAKDAELAAVKAELAQAKAKAGIAAGAAKDPGPGSSNVTLRRSQMTRAAKAAFQKEHGGEAYRQLPE